MPRQITEKLREQRRLAAKRFYDKKKKEGYIINKKWVKKDNKTD